MAIEFVVRQATSSFLNKISTIGNYSMSAFKEKLNAILKAVSLCHIRSRKQNTT